MGWMNTAFNDLQSRVLLSKKVDSFTCYFTTKWESQTAFFSVHVLLMIILFKASALSFPSVRVDSSNWEGGSTTMPPSYSQKYSYFPHSRTNTSEKVVSLPFTPVTVIAWILFWSQVLCSWLAAVKKRKSSILLCTEQLPTKEALVLCRHISKFS